MSDQNENNVHNESDDEQSASGMVAYKALGEFLETDGWHPQPDSRQLCLPLHVRRRQRRGDLLCPSSPGPGAVYLLRGHAHARPEEMRVPMAEFLTRANYGLRIGNFEMDFEDGEVRYKSSVDFEGIELRRC